MDTIRISTAGKKEQYEELLPQLKALLADESDTLANLANAAAALKQTFQQFSWAGWYILKQGELVLGPFQGNIACTRIALDRGVCGAAASRRETVIVPDVDAFPGHIACDGGSKSEIVVPLIRNGELLGVLDVDSYSYDTFDDVDRDYLEQVVGFIASIYTTQTPIL
jgi:L-methionine (R)-S-oxide reductase